MGGTHLVSDDSIHNLYFLLKKKKKKVPHQAPTGQVLKFFDGQVPPS